MLRLLQAAGREGGGTGAKGQERDPGSSAEQAAEGEDGPPRQPPHLSNWGRAGPAAGRGIDPRTLAGDSAYLARPRCLLPEGLQGAVWYCGQNSAASSDFLSAPLAS